MFSEAKDVLMPLRAFLFSLPSALKLQFPLLRSLNASPGIFVFSSRSTASPRKTRSSSRNAPPGIYFSSQRFAIRHAVFVASLASMPLPTPLRRLRRAFLFSLLARFRLWRSTAWLVSMPSRAFLLSLRSLKERRSQPRKCLNAPPGIFVFQQ